VSGRGSAAAPKRSGGARVPSKPAAPRAASKAWVPERQDVIWIDCNPQAGGEMRDLHPMLVLSPGAFNARTGLVIGLPMTTAAYNANNPFALAVGAAGGRKTGKTSYVLCHQPKSFDWRARRAKPHPQGKLADAAFEKACAVLNQIISIE
jgi:mRNA interferase MazF